MTNGDVATATRDTLLALISELRALLAVLQTTISQQEATIAERQKRISAIEQRLTARGGAGMPGNKPAATKPKPPTKPRKERAYGYGRPRLVPTETVQHAVKQCPTCQTPLVGGWVQRTRDIHDLTELYPTDASLTGWAAAVRTVFDDAVAFASVDEPARLAKQYEREERFLAVCRPFLADPVAVQGKLCRRIERHRAELFVFVGNPAVPPTNNAAELSLRHLVISRKISGGTQSPQGTTSKMTLASLYGTWRARGMNPLHACRKRLISPDH